MNKMLLNRVFHFICHELLILDRVEKSAEAFYKPIFVFRRSWDIEQWVTPKLTLKRPTYECNTTYNTL